MSPGAVLGGALPGVWVAGVLSHAPMWRPHPRRPFPDQLPFASCPLGALGAFCAAWKASSASPGVS